MTDLEITKACAEAMGIETSDDIGQPMLHDLYYKPLHDEAQCFALVKKFSLQIESGDTCSIEEGGDWLVYRPNPHRWNSDGNQNGREETLAADRDLNRAICLCVAKMSGGR